MLEKQFECDAMVVYEILGAIMSGKLYGIGVGPGDPELMTLKAKRILDEADVVAYVMASGAKSFARAIVSDFIVNDQQEYGFEIPMKPSRQPAQLAYDHAAIDIAGFLDAGKNVVVLCEGDPFFYGSFMYLFERLSGQYETEIVPGISSLNAGAAALKRPIAARNDVLTVIPAPLASDKINELLANADAICFIKIGRHFERIRALIEDAGLMSCSGYLERVSGTHEKIMALADVSGNEVPYFSTIMIYKGNENWGAKK